ncbi:MAG TPA: hypothetical protein VKT78_02750 [Fimbriimonadaceae bacterium]|nr:hypothetical protein [Fimbriimonadaceae bacterium]
MSTNRFSRLKLLGFGVIVVIIGAIAYLGRPYPDELSFLKGYQYKLNKDPSGDSDTYVIQGDPRAIQSAIPGMPAPPTKVTAQSAVAEIKLPSGRHARFVGSPSKQEALLTIEGKPDPMITRAMHRLGF